MYSNVIPKPGGPYSLYCTSCHRWIPNTANYEMKKEGVFAHSHFCSNGKCLSPNDGGIDDVDWQPVNR